MLFAVDYNDCRVHIEDTHSNKEYFCPYCGTPLITRKGDIRQHHFAHKSQHRCSDTWEQSRSYDISPWHNAWQERFPKENQEIRLTLGETKHRADVLIGRAVIEFQHSLMASKNFDDRNNFYFNLGYKVIWLFDLTELIEKGKITYSRNENGLRFSWKNPKRAFNSYDVNTGCIDLFFQIRDSDDSCIVRVKEVSECGFEEFDSTELMSSNDFLEWIGLKNGVCEEPDRDDLERNEKYLLFKEKYNIQLNKQQERALQAIEGSNLLLAVPGSGKTTVLVSRLGYMVREKNIDPGSILAITFTTSAADEMKNRFLTNFGYSSGEQVDFKTINSLSLEIYKRFCKLSEKEPRRLIEGKNLHKLCGKIYHRFHSDEYASESDIIELKTTIAYVKNMMLEPNQILDIDADYPKFSQMYDAYKKELEANNQMDFDDQMFFAHWILQNDSKHVLFWQNRYKYICVDEAQDTSKIQHDIIRIISKGNSLFMVGDEDQSIYGFRAAFPKALLNFRFDYNNPYILRMERNYRSTTQIVEKAQSFITVNKGRYEKKMIAERGKGEPVELIQVVSVEEQYRRILDIAKEANDETAFLYRDNESSVVLVDLFLRNQIDFKLKKPEQNFFGHKVVRDIIAYLTIALKPFEAGSLNQICNKGIIYLRKEQKNHAINNSKQRRITIFDALDEQMKYVSSDFKGRAKNFRSVMTCISKQSSESAINVLLEKGYASYLEEKHLDRNKVENLLMLAKQEPDIARFLSRLFDLEKLMSDGFQSNKDGKIILSTIHSSKGLEYNSVYMVDVYDGRFPSSKRNFFARSKDNADGEQEERRLFYVGITRAKNKLVLFSIENKTSRYIDELFPEVRATRISAEQERERNRHEGERLRKFQQVRLREKQKQQKLAEETQEMDKEEKKKSIEQVTPKRDYMDRYNEVKDRFMQQDTQIRDSTDERWLECEFCGKIHTSDEFASYGGPGRVNLGTCNDCKRKEREV